MEETRYSIELLHWAGMNNIAEIADIIVQHPELINSVNANNDNALMVATRLGNLNTVIYLVEDTKININHENEEGSALLIAFKYGHIQIGEFLLAQDNINLNSKCAKGKTIYHYMAASGFDDGIELMLEKGININQLDMYNQHCLFDLIYRYRSTYYPAFEIIQENLSDDIVFVKNNQNVNIIEYMNEIIEESKIAKNDFRTKAIIDNFDLLFKILNQKTI